MYKKAVIYSLFLGLLLLPLQVWADDPSANKNSVSEEVLSLDQCLELGYKNSPQLKNAAQNIVIATEGLRQAYGGLLPTVNYSVSTTNPSGSGDPYNGSISLNANLYNGGKTTTAIKLAQLKLDLTREDQRKAKQQLTFNIKNAFYSLWLAQQMRTVAQSSYDNMGQHYQHMVRSNKLGLVTQFEVLSAQAQRESLKPALIKAELAVDLAKIKLANYLGFDRNRQFKVDLDITRIQFLKNDSLVIQTLLDEALKNRPEMHQTDQQIQIANCNIQLAKSGYKPTITLSEKYGGGGSEFNLGEWDNTWTLTANLSGPIFDGFVTPEKVAAAKASLEIAKVNQSNQQNQIRVEVESTLKNIEKTLETINSNQVNIGLAKESLRLTQIRVDAGMATTIDVKDAQLELDMSLNGYYQGVATYLTSLAQLDLDLGRDMEANNK